jgi:hypothetical protein
MICAGHAERDPGAASPFEALDGSVLGVVDPAPAILTLQLDGGANVLMPLKPVISLAPKHGVLAGNRAIAPSIRTIFRILERICKSKEH